MADTLDLLLADLAVEQGALDVVVTSVDPEEWDTETPAPGWSVRHQIAHLTFYDEQATLAVSDPPGFEARRDETLAALARGEFGTAGPYATQSVPGLLDRWRAGRLHLADAFAGVDPKARIVWYGPSMSARSSLTARLMECWAHGVDITDAFGLPPSTSDRLRHVAHLGVVTRPWSYAVRGDEPPDVEVAVVLTPPGGGDDWVWGDPDAAERIEGTALDFCLVVTQRRPAGDTALRAVGPAAADWLRVAQAFAGGPTTTTRQPL